MLRDNCGQVQLHERRGEPLSLQQRNLWPKAFSCLRALLQSPFLEWDAGLLVNPQQHPDLSRRAHWFVMCDTAQAAVVAWKGGTGMGPEQWQPQGNP